MLLFVKGGEQSPDSRTGGCCKMAPNGRNDLKFCMQGSFVGYIWVLAKLRSHSLYGGQTNISHFWHLLSVKYAHSTPITQKLLGLQTSSLACRGLSWVLFRPFSLRIHRGQRTVLAFWHSEGARIEKYWFGLHRGCVTSTWPKLNINAQNFRSFCPSEAVLWVIVQYIGYGHCSRYGETGTYFVDFKYLIPD